MAPALNEVERRVFGVLLEKALAQPQYYPMTINAIVAACNQKSNRDPVLELDEEAVWNTLEVLRAGGLVSRLLPGGASRVERFKHEAKERLGWEKPQRAVMAELLLRGPQTLGDLRGHCARMFPFDTLDAVSAVLEILRQAAPPMVATLPRGPGQSATRYAHCLYHAEEWARLTQDAGVSASVAGDPEGGPAGRPATAGPPATADHPAPRASGDAFRADLEELRGAVKDLQAEVAGLKTELARLREGAAPPRG